MSRWRHPFFLKKCEVAVLQSFNGRKWASGYYLARRYTNRLQQAVSVLVTVLGMTSVLIEPIYEIFSYETFAHILLLGILKQFSFAKYVGEGLRWITLLKLIFIDPPNLSLIVKAVLFILLGLLGLLVSRIFYRKT